MAASLLSRLPRGAVRPADLMLIVAVVAIVALLILPLPAIMIDMLVATNIAIGLLLLLSTLHITKPLDFSTFPTVLLLSTLFRLSLSIATTRMILTTAEGGHIIQQFGEMVAGGNLIVGLVVFLIITVVQFIVISKGAERVAEVAARFSLDAMPGKQLSIDSDLRSGLIGKDEARERRRTLELESKLHGSLDGAMKFVKGDAIASIVIVLINLVGGLAVGVFSHGMEAGEAMQVFSILTIGDGLVAQIPALFSAMAAGLLVTRTTDESRDGSLGPAIVQQIGSKPKVLAPAAILCLLMALIPGFPAAVFIGIAFALGSAAAWQHPVSHAWIMGKAARFDKGEKPLPQTLAAQPEAPRPVRPLVLEIAAPALDAAQAERLRARFVLVIEAVQARQQVFLDIGTPLARRARLHPVGNGLHGLGEEGARARRRVEDLHPVHVLADRYGLALLVGLPGVPVHGHLARIGQPVGNAEFGLQHVVDRADDEVDHRLGRVPDAARLALLRIVSGEEGLVEMDKGIVAGGEVAKIGE